MIPWRVCCGQQHIGIVCPDSMVMCCLCFDRFEIDELAEDEDGSKVDVCIGCREYEIQGIKEKFPDS